MGMKIVAARSQNDVLWIDRFCRAYFWADAILIADKGSTDGTAERALAFPNVHIRGWQPKDEEPLAWFLDRWAVRLGAEWIIWAIVPTIPGGSRLSAVPNWSVLRDLPELLQDENVLVTLPVFGISGDGRRCGPADHRTWATRRPADARGKALCCDPPNVLIDRGLPETHAGVPIPEWLQEAR